MTSNDRRQHPQVLSAAHLILILIPILEQLRLFGPSFAPPSSVNIIVKQHTNDHTSSSDNSDRPTDRRRERRHRPRRRSPYLSRPIMIEPLPSEQINIRKYTNPDRVRIHPAKVTGHAWPAGQSASRANLVPSAFVRKENESIHRFEDIIRARVPLALPIYCVKCCENTFF